MFININEDNYLMMMQAIDKYIKSNPSKYCTGNEKDRFVGREKLFNYLLYGIKEIKQ